MNQLDFEFILVLWVFLQIIPPASNIITSAVRSTTAAAADDDAAVQAASLSANFRKKFSSNVG